MTINCPDAGSTRCWARDSSGPAPGLPSRRVSSPPPASDRACVSIGNRCLTLHLVFAATLPILPGHLPRGPRGSHVTAPSRGGARSRPLRPTDTPPPPPLLRPLGPASPRSALSVRVCWAFVPGTLTRSRGFKKPLHGGDARVSISAQSHDPSLLLPTPHLPSLGVTDPQTGVLPAPHLKSGSTLLSSASSYTSASAETVGVTATPLLSHPRNPAHRPLL